MTLPRIAVFVALAAWSALGLAQKKLLATWGDCSPVIERASAPITIICNVDKGLQEALQKLLAQQSNVQAYNRLAADFEAAQAATADLRGRVRELEGRAGRDEPSRRAKDLLDRQLREQARAQEELRAEMQRRVNQVSEILLEVMARELQSREARDAEQARMLRAELARNLDDALADLARQLRKEIEGINAELRILEEKVKRLEGIVSVLELARRGQLTETVGFWGFSAGAGSSDDNETPWASLEHEWLLPEFAKLKMRGSALVELGFLKWKEDRKFPTLPGAAAQTVRDEHELWPVGVGLRLLLPLGETYAIPLAGVVGTTLGTDKTAYLAGTLGLESFHPALRFALEVRYHWLHRVATREMRFNPFGPATITEQKSSRDLVTVAARVSWR